MDAAGDQTPEHLQQLHAIAAALQADKRQSDSVTWVPELIPTFIQRAVESAVQPQPEEPDEQQEQQEVAREPERAASQDHQHDDDGEAGVAGAAAAGSCGSRLFQHTSGGSSSAQADWLMTTCLVPEGMPTAAAAQGSGGLAALEVVCRVLILQDCVPCEAPPPALVKALSRVKWSRYGLAFREFLSCDDGTGILELAVLPEAVVVPLSLVVCCFMSLPRLSIAGPDADATEPTAAAAAGADDGPASIDASTRSSRPAKRRRGATPAQLSLRRSVPLWVGAFADALADLKGRLPPGYLMARIETVVGASLPHIAASLANIMTRATNAQLRDQCCGLLQCEPAAMERCLLSKLQDAAAIALAAGERPAPAVPAAAAAAGAAGEEPEAAPAAVSADSLSLPVTGAPPASSEPQLLHEVGAGWQQGGDGLEVSGGAAGGAGVAAAAPGGSAAAPPGAVEMPALLPAFPAAAPKPPSQQQQQQQQDNQGGAVAGRPLQLRQWRMPAATGAWSQPALGVGAWLPTTAAGAVSTRRRISGSAAADLF